MSKLRKMVSVLARYGSRLNEKLTFERQIGKIKIAVEIALLRKNHGKRSKKYGTLCGRPKRSLTETVGYGTVRHGHGRRINSEPLLYKVFRTNYTESI
jgi:hypothetical protein